jgi:hypothetical protein
MKEINSIILYFQIKLGEAITERRPEHYVPKWKIKQIQDQLANALKVKAKMQSAIDIFNSIQEVK